MVWYKCEIERYWCYANNRKPLPLFKWKGLTAETLEINFCENKSLKMFVKILIVKLNCNVSNERLNLGDEINKECQRYTVWLGFILILRCGKWILQNKMRLLLK